MKRVLLAMLVVLGIGLGFFWFGTSSNPGTGDTPAPLEEVPVSAAPDTAPDTASDHDTELEDLAGEREAAIAKWRIQTADDQTQSGASGLLIEVDPEEEPVIYSTAPRTQLPNLFQKRPTPEKKLSVSGRPTLAPEDETTTTPKIIGGSVEVEIKLD